MDFLDVALLIGAALGHTVLWVSAGNRVHSLGIPSWLIHALTLLSALALAIVPPAIALRLWRSDVDAAPAPLRFYLWLCAAIGAWAFCARLWTIVTRPERASVQRACRREPVDVTSTLTGPVTVGPVVGLVTRLPGNQALDLVVETKEIALPRMPSQLAGLRIAHLSDLHMSGRIDRPWFEEVVRVANRLEPDVVAVTGDLFDHQSCVEWIPSTLARLEARCGVYFIMGNHDIRVDWRAARKTLSAAGLVDLGGRWKEVSIDGATLVLAGNELPWFPPAADLASCPVRSGEPRPLRLLLSHAPEQIGWARRHDVDLMLAGHTHGGQIRLPVLGPLVVPSRAGTRYAAGTYHQPPTVLHVSRGISSMMPLRWNCPPELALLELVAG